MNDYAVWVEKTQSKNDPFGLDVRSEPKFYIPSVIIYLLLEFIFLGLFIFLLFFFVFLWFFKFFLFLMDFV
jgi:hypothetical protein